MVVSQGLCNNSVQLAPGWTGVEGGSVCFRLSERKVPASHSGPEKKQQQTTMKAEPRVAPPPQEPRVPYPYVSSLSEKEQRRYLFLLSEYLNADPNLLHWSQQRNYTQYLVCASFLFSFLFS